jgi:carboxyl-terminal processing protease
MKGWRIVGIAALALAIFGWGIWGGILIEKQNVNAVTVSQDKKADFELMNQAWNIIQQKYVDQSAVDNQTITYGAISGMVNSLGDTGHSVFLTPKEVQEENDAIQGQYDGIGVQIEAKNGKVVIVTPFDGSPAQNAGLQPGDIILEVGGKPITSVTEAQTNVKGAAGTSVTLTILKTDGTTQTVTLIRAKITLVNVTWNMLPGTTIAHLRLASFSVNTTDQLDKALVAIKAQGATSIILDLRDNPGGLLDQAVGVASRFLDSGNVLLEKDMSGKITSIPVDSGVTVTKLPMVVLINEGTASAAEIVSGALQDAGRAKLIGETTFGTGTVLVSYKLSDGSELVLAIQEWLTPAGKTIWHTGLTPDTVVALASSVNPLIPQTEIANKMTMDQIKASGDQQLLDAMGMLK